MGGVKIATWNINSVRARTDHLIAFLRTRQPDVLCLQETKCTDDQFPTLEVRAAGYQEQLFGQKSYNGVALLTKTPATDLRRNLGNDDEQARVISGVCDGIRVVGLYAPNGQSLESEPYRYKLGWYAALSRWLSFARGSPLLLCGDFNVAPADLDIYDPRLFGGQTLCSAKERAAYEALVSANGLVDLFRAKFPSTPGFTWWDYRLRGFEKDHGLRIDLMLVSADLVDRCVGIEVDRQTRAEKLPSDHAPLIAHFA